MIVRVITKSYSLYHFDSKQMTWKRHNHRPEANTLMGATDLEGKLDYWPDFRIGEPLYFNTIRSTPVQLIELMEE